MTPKDFGWLVRAAEAAEHPPVANSSCGVEPAVPASAVTGESGVEPAVPASAVTEESGVEPAVPASAVGVRDSVLCRFAAFVTYSSR